MAGAGPAAEKTKVVLGTATPGGGFPVYGQAVAETIHETDPSLEVETRNTKGSTENVPLLEAGQLDLGLVQGEVAYEALSGIGRPPANLRILAAMYSTPGMFVVRADSPARTIDDLKGKPVAFGAKGSGLVILARYVLDGGVRKSGKTVRINARIVDTATGEQVWAENYDRELTQSDWFALQDDVTAKIVSTAGDRDGALPRAMSALVKRKPANSVTPYEAVVRLFSYYQLVSADEHLIVRTLLERAVEQAPDYADAWAALALMFLEEFKQGYNVRPDALKRAAEATARALALDPANQIAYYSLATTRFFQKDFDAFRHAAQRALALNPFDGGTRAWMGLLIAYAGDWERGLALVEQAKQLNPHHPGWYHFAFFWQHFRNRQFAEALREIRKVNMPAYPYYHASVGAVCGHLGRIEEARRAIQELLRLFPEFPSCARQELGKWLEMSYVEILLEGLRKAGLADPGFGGAAAEAVPAGATAASSPASGEARLARGDSDSGRARAEEGFWVAVLPFKYNGPSAELTALAEGLTEEIITGLSRFSYLRVIARGSTARLRGEAVDVHSAGSELGARYVMEGSLRQAGTRLRVAVQLVDAESGAHLWAESYECAFRPEGVFELQDELVPKIVSTVADAHGVLPRTMSAALRSRAPETLSPYEAVLRSFGYFERVTAEELAAASAGLEAAVEKAPAYADAWAMLALLCVQDYAQGFEVHADSLAQGASESA